MRTAMVLAMLLIASTAPLQADTMYVSDLLKITLRSGPGADHRVIAMLRSGEEVEAMQSENEWTQVRLSSGKEGWVLSRLLTADKPKILLLEQTAERNKDLAAQIDGLLQKNSQLDGLNKGLENELARANSRLQETDRACQALQSESAEFLSLQAKYRKSAQELQQQTKMAHRLEAEVEKLKSNQNLKWFLIGAGAVLAGFLLGLTAKRQRRRY